MIQPLIWDMLYPGMTYDHLGLLPTFVSGDDPRPAREQFNERYVSGWDPMKGFKLDQQDWLHYPGDPPLRPIALAYLRSELILFYEHEWVAIVQPDRSFEVCRMD